MSGAQLPTYHGPRTYDGRRWRRGRDLRPRVRPHPWAPPRFSVNVSYERGRVAYALVYTWQGRR